MLSPLTRRIMAVNMVALAIPVVGLLYLGPYRDALIQSDMEALRAQGEIFAGALGEGAVGLTRAGEAVLSLAPAQQILFRLAQSSNLRARLFGRDGAALADSQRLSALGATVDIEELAPPASMNEVISPMLDFLSRLELILSRQNIEKHPTAPGESAADFPEAVSALQGEITGVVRETEDGVLVLSVALPVQRYYQVFGALMLSKDGDEIAAALREVRITILQVFGAALLATIALSLYLAGVIARPLNRLAAAAEQVRHNLGREGVEIPDMSARGDEIGDLSGVLRDMTQALQHRLRAIERFAADVSHEIKNPLTSLRSAVETASRIDDPVKKEKLMQIILDDVTRLDRLITDVSDASRLDAELSRDIAAPLEMEAVMSTLANLYAAGSDGGNSAVKMQTYGSGPFSILGVEDRLVQVFRNLISNAVSFSPRRGSVTLTLRREGAWIEMAVEDEGPGVPANKLKDIFSRFYTERPEGEKFGAHSGLGLAISKQIVEAHGGEIFAENRTAPSGDVLGARFVVRLPAAE
ncbi:MAG: stimulus-sensing domain-containing protein [Alphaproteobacteria bacterium]|nr:stimulus-sensing domain-containing protein [Alphaproteobacteria bacterium]